jgi:uncharacterized alkaline shock family protein YloU
VEGSASISSDVLASYAADAAKQVAGVAGLVESHLHRHRGVRITGEDGRVAVELHVALCWGAPVREVGRAVQNRVAEYLEQMAGARPRAVDVVVDRIGPPA